MRNDAFAAMNLDMHVHTNASDDAAATPEAYLKWLDVLRKKYVIDGVVFTEHRSYDWKVNYEGLAQEHGLLVLRGVEVETDHGHFLLYGVSEGLLARFDLGKANLPALELIEQARETGGIAVPCHPGRPVVGLCDYLSRGDTLLGVKVVEQLNGSSNEEENRRATELASEKGYYGIGGSDAHYVTYIGSCLTQFDSPIADMGQLVEELHKGNYRPIRLEDAFFAPP
jgi:hypothetical protein